MATSKITVTTDVGTFTRQTARTYTHIVVVKGYRAEVLEARRQRDLAYYRREIASYQQIIDTDGRSARGIGWEPRVVAECLATGKYQGWIDGFKREIQKLEAMGPITADQGDTWLVHGWCGRLQLAVNQTRTEQVTSYREVRIYEVATGKRVQ